MRYRILPVNLGTPALTIEAPQVELVRASPEGEANLVRIFARRGERHCAELNLPYAVKRIADSHDRNVYWVDANGSICAAEDA